MTQGTTCKYAIGDDEVWITYLDKHGKYKGGRLPISPGHVSTFQKYTELSGSPSVESFGILNSFGQRRPILVLQSSRDSKFSWGHIRPAFVFSKMDTKYLEVISSEKKPQSNISKQNPRPLC